MPGRKPKPTKMKIIEGNPGHRSLPLDEVDPLVEDYLPDPPENLNESAQKEWRTMGPALHRLGLLTELDYPAFAAYCQAYAQWFEAVQGIKKTGIVIRTTTGNVIQSPMVGIVNRSAELMHKFLTEFGMTPSSRAKVSLSDGGSVSKFAGLLAKKRF